MIDLRTKYLTTAGTHWYATHLPVPQEELAGGDILSGQMQQLSRNQPQAAPGSHEVEGSGPTQMVLSETLPVRWY